MQIYILYYENSTLFITLLSYYYYLVQVNQPVRIISLKRHLILSSLLMKCLKLIASRDVITTIGVGQSRVPE